MEFAYPSIISDEDRKQIKEMKEKFLKLNVGSGDGYLKDLLEDTMHNEHIVSLKNKKVFISGPMRGYEKYNFPKFDRIEKILTDNGIECVNPARISRKFKEVEILNSENKFNEMVKQQQEAEKTCNALLLLDGWQHSKGVMLELKTAIDLDVQILLESDLYNILIDRLC